MFDAIYDAVKGLGSAAMYQFTDRIFEHFLSAVLVITMTGRVTVEETLKVLILLVLVYIAIEIHKKVDGSVKPVKKGSQDDSPSI